MIKKVVIPLFFFCTSMHCMDTKMFAPVLDPINVAMNYANSGWGQRAAFIAGGTAAMGIGASLKAEDGEKWQAAQYAMGWGFVGASLILATYAVWNSWLPVKELSGIGTLGLGLIMFIPLIEEREYAVMTAAVLLAGAFGATGMARWLKSKKMEKKEK